MSNQNNVLAARVGQLLVAKIKQGAGSLTRSHKLLESLCEQVIQSEGQRLQFRVDEFIENGADSDSGSQLRKCFRVFDDWLERLSDQLAEIAVDNKIQFRPRVVVEKRDGRVLMDFAAQPVDTRATPALRDVPAGAIRYTIEDRRALPRWVRWLSGAQFGWGSASLMVVLLFGIGLFFLLVAIIGGVLIMNTSSLSSVLMGVGLLLLPVMWYRPWRAWYELPFRRYVMLPEFLTGVTKPTLLLLRHVGDEKLPRMELLFATAKCPVCGGKIILATARDFRVYGACSVNPAEHSFSFDFTTKLGYPR